MLSIRLPFWLENRIGGDVNEPPVIARQHACKTLDGEIRAALNFNAEHLESFIQFAIKACPAGDIELSWSVSIGGAANRALSAEVRQKGGIPLPATP